MSGVSTEQLKSRSKRVSKFLEEKYGVKVSHGHCLELVSMSLGLKDWNTARAVSPPEALKAEEPKSSLSERRQKFIEVLKQDFDVRVELPYFEEQYHVGGSTASHKTERGVLVFDNFHLRTDERMRTVTLTLPEIKRETASDLLLQINKQGYLEREKLFAEKLGGTAKDFAK